MCACMSSGCGAETSILYHVAFPHYQMTLLKDDSKIIYFLKMLLIPPQSVLDKSIIRISCTSFHYDIYTLYYIIYLHI